jgi:Fur family peroxide stress response transcriptional regulator
MLTLESAQQALRGAGVRLTPQRTLIINALVGNRAHPTVEQLYHLARERYAGISLATVYHTVSLLARHGLVRELHGDTQGLRCDPDTSPHAHGYCLACHTVIDLPLPDIPTVAIAEHAFTAVATEMSLYGYCPTCAAND